MQESNLIINTDGGARGNPGPGAAAFVAYNSKEEVVAKNSKYLGKTTNNAAEYQGVLLALEWLETIGNAYSKITFRLDSQLVVKQLTGEYKIKNSALAMLASLVISKCKLFSKIEFIHIPRSQNSPADFLVNRCLDENKSA